MTKHRLVPVICCLLVLMFYIANINDNAAAQISQSRLESIVSQPDTVTSAQIDVETDPSFIGSSIYAQADNLYIANTGSNTVSVINPFTSTVVKNIDVGDSPVFIDIPPLVDNIYVANSGNDTVSVIDVTLNTVIKNITVGDSPEFIESFEYPQLGFTDIYVANTGSNTVSVINSTTNTVVKNITVGYAPNFIHVSPLEHNIYVSNRDSSTISVIDPTTNSVVKNICCVGYFPISIDTYKNKTNVDTIYGDIYVVNFDSNTVSVINSTTNTVVKNITVGDYPQPIYTHGDSIYVANYGSNTVSVINPDTNTVIKNITVGAGPTFIHAPTNEEETVYVANSDSDGVSVIDSTTNEVLAAVTFDINPFQGGQIICNGLPIPINRNFYVASGTGCLAKPNNGFEFSSWTQNLPQNSSITANASTTTSDSPWTSFLEIFGVKSNDPAANLTINKFGSFIAYFKALPPPVPAEYVASLFTIVITALVGSLLIPAAVSWFRSKKQTSRLNSFHQQMALVYADGKLDEKDIDRLNTINNNISDSYAAGKITNDQYMHLKNEVSTSFQKIFKKRIESIADPNTEAVNNIKNDIEDAYSDRKITELDYNLLNGKISRMFDNR